MSNEAVFIGYRRDDTADVAGRIFDALVNRFGRHRIFKDVDNMRPGSDFGAHLRTVVPRCRTMLVLIGPHWLEARDETGARRLDDPYDWVRIEIETALTTPGLTVVPLLINGARMPRADELPPTLHPLVTRHAAIIRRDPDFHDDVRRLVNVLQAEMGDSATPGSVEMTPSANTNFASSSFAGVLAVLLGVAAFQFGFLVFNPQEDQLFYWPRLADSGLVTPLFALPVLWLMKARGVLTMRGVLLLTLALTVVHLNAGAIADWLSQTLTPRPAEATQRPQPSRITFFISGAAAGLYGAAMSFLFYSAFQPSLRTGRAFGRMAGFAIVLTLLGAFGLAAAYPTQNVEHMRFVTFLFTPWQIAFGLMTLSLLRDAAPTEAPSGAARWLITLGAIVSTVLLYRFALIVAYSLMAFLGSEPPAPPTNVGTP